MLFNFSGVEWLLLTLVSSLNLFPCRAIEQSDLTEAFANVSGLPLDWFVTTTPLCARTGITCSLQRVTVINLSSIGISGQPHWPSIPANTKTLRMERNSLGGSINLHDLPSKLEHISLNSNSFVGSLDLSHSPSELKQFDLASNDLHGSLDLSVLPSSLQFVSLSDNNFCGTIDLSALPPTITWLDLSNNHFTGSLDLTQLPPAMQGLILAGNQFDGIVDLSELPPMLASLHLHDNKLLSGPVSFTRIPSNLSITLEPHVFCGCKHPSARRLSAHRSTSKCVGVNDCMASCGCASTTIVTSRTTALIAFSVGLSNLPSSWVPSTDPCRPVQWDGVTCDASGVNVLAIDISNQGVVGVFLLDRLPRSVRHLDVSDNPLLSGRLNVSTYPRQLSLLRVSNTSINTCPMMSLCSSYISTLASNATIFADISNACPPSRCTSVSKRTMKIEVRCSGSKCASTCACAKSSRSFQLFSTSSSSLDIKPHDVFFFFGAFVAGMGVLFAIMGECASRANRQEDYRFFRVMAGALYSFDYLSDIAFGVYLVTFGNEYLALAVVSFILLFLTLVVNMISLQYYLVVYQSDERVSRIVYPWTQQHHTSLIALGAVTASCYGGMNLANSSLFGLQNLSMGLPRRYLHDLSFNRLYTTVLIQNLPQLFIQIFFVATRAHDTPVSAMVILTMVSSAVSVVSTLGQMYVHKQMAQQANLFEVWFEFVVVCPEFTNKFNKHRHRITTFRQCFASVLSTSEANIELLPICRVKDGVLFSFCVLGLQSESADTLRDRFDGVCVDRTLAQAFLASFNLRSQPEIIRPNVQQKQHAEQVMPVMTGIRSMTFDRGATYLQNEE